MSANPGSSDPVAQSFISETTPPRTPSEPILDTTPLSVKANRNVHNPADHRDYTAAEMNGRFAEVAYDKFMEFLIKESNALEPTELHTTLPPNYQTALQKPLEKLEKFTFEGHENRSYPILCALIEGAFQLARPFTSEKPLHVHDTSQRRDLTDKREKGSSSARVITESKLEPDISIHKEVDDAPYELTDQKRKEAKVSSEDRRPWLGRVSWRNMRLYVEVKKAKSPFTLYGILDPDAGDNTAKGQISEYAAEMRLAQHRLFSYAVVTCRQSARLIRWDQAGGLVSTSFDYKEDPSKLLRFFFLVGQMSDKQLGLDPTVEAADTEEVNLWDQCAKTIDDEYTRRLVDAARQWKLSKVTVNGEDLATAEARWESKRNTASVPTTAPRQLLVGRPHVGHHTPVGRGTKGYVAFDLQDKRFVFLKDSWRLEHDKREPEMLFYALLHKKDVVNIPEVICGGDVYSPSGSLQRTCTDQHLERGYCAYIHTRLVIKEIGRPLNEYKNSRELALSVRDAIEAHRMAWVAAKILHRDISEGNIIIMIVEGQVEGKLIDWENARKIQDLNKGATNPVRSGTWIFLSGLMVSFPRKPIELSDDLESFVHVVMWQVQRYHELVDYEEIGMLHDYIRHKYLVTAKMSGGYTQGHAAKMAHMKSASFGEYPPSTEKNSPAFLELLTSLLDLCQEHYKQVDSKKMRAWYQVSSSSTGQDTQTKDANDRVLQAYKGTTRLQSHDAILELFEEACNKTRILENNEAGTLANLNLAAYDWIPDKAEDQFLGMPEFKYTSRIGGSSATGSAKRPSVSNEEEPSTSVKRMKRQTTSSTSATLRSVPE